MSAHDDVRANRIQSLREDMRKSSKKELTEKQYLLGVVLMAGGRDDAYDEFVEGFELVRSAHDNGNESAGGYLRFLADISPDTFDVVSEIGDERRKLLESFAPPPMAQASSSSAVLVQGIDALISAQ